MVLVPPRPADITIITGQLGRRPHGALAVPYRCPAGHPGVLLTYPPRRRAEFMAPFPSHLWLTCPRLSAQLSELERIGAIERLHRILMGSRELQGRFAEDHRRCITHRWSLLTEQDRHAVRRANMAHVFHRRGIGGVRRWMSIKCLHLHFAQHLTLGDTVGRLLAEIYAIEPCRAGTATGTTS